LTTPHKPLLILLGLAQLQQSNTILPYEQVRQLLKQAEYLIERINRTITTSQNTNEIEEQLGNPSPANCVNCTYRHQCKPYWNRRAISRRDNWPNDVQGMYLDVQHLCNNKGLLKLLWKGSEIKIRGLDLERHNISAGSLICAYGLLRDDVTHSYSEGLLTTIYSENSK